ncbi:hypothetical protein BH11GEM1_BH11GEM1_36540 [soil metagenome]
MLRYISLAMATLVLFACTSAVAPSSEQPWIIGTIARVDGQPVARILIAPVELPVPTTSASDSLVLLIDKSSAIDVRTSDGRTTAGTVSDLVPGRHIQAWRGSADYRTRPPQYDAVRVLVLIT